MKRHTALLLPRELHTLETCHHESHRPNGRSVISRKTTADGAPPARATGSPTASNTATSTRLTLTRLRQTFLRRNIATKSHCSFISPRALTDGPGESSGHCRPYSSPICPPYFCRFSFFFPIFFQFLSNSRAYGKWEIGSGKGVDIVRHGGNGHYKSSFEEYVLGIMEERDDQQEPL